MEKNRRKFPWLPVAGIAVLACAAGLFWLSQNPTPIARWALKKAMPRAGIALDSVRFGEPGEIIFENFVLPDPITGKPLLRLERGRLVFTFSDILRRRIGEIHLVNPLLVISPGWSGVFPKTADESKNAPAPTIRRIFCDFGEVRYEGSSTGRPDIAAKFCMDWKEIGGHSEELQDFTLWDIQATALGFQNPFLVLDLMRWPRFLDHWPVKISDGCRGLVGCYRGRAFRSISFWDWSPIFVSVAQGPAGLGA